jgi:DNA-binding CsgD family transcriptional regulator
VRALAPPPEPRWMLLLSTVRLPVSANLRAWAAASGLSAAETRVLLRVAAGDSAREAAAALGITPATVRSQLRAIGRKTGLGGVAALQRALTGLPPVTAPAPAPAQGK